MNGANEPCLHGSQRRRAPPCAVIPARDKPVDDALLRRLIDLTKFGPTSANASPARFVVVKSPEAKARLKPALSEGNLAKTMAAPVTVIVGMDLAFHEHLPRLFPHSPRVDFDDIARIV